MEHNISTTEIEPRADFFIEGERYYNFYLKLIDQAQVCIHLQTYIFTMDHFGQQVQTALIRAARRGVKIYIIVDGIGSNQYSRKSELELQTEDIYFCRFNGVSSFKFLYQWGRRLHHKILLVDQLKAIVGGINVTTSGYNHPQIMQQLDFAVYLEGSVVIDLARCCQNIFKNSFDSKININLQPVQMNLHKYKKSDLKIQLSINDWARQRYQITNQYLHLLDIAETELTIINSYFFPTLLFIKKLIAAKKRGVRIRLILPNMSDWPSVVFASQYLYKYFLDHGFEIYEWNKSVLHGKLATVDGLYSTLGSFNLSHTGFYQNLELNINIKSELFTKNVDILIQDIIDIGCQKITYKSFNLKSTLKIRMLRFLCYVILSAISRLSILFTFQNRNSNRHKKLN